MNKSRNDLNYPVEYLVFQIEDASNISLFLSEDYKIWTLFLAKQEGFVSKEMWVNDNTPGEIHSLITWKTLDAWKSISKEKVEERKKDFITAFPYKFSIKRKVHQEYKNKFIKFNDVEQYTGWE